MRKSIIGIYSISNIINNKQYIGSSTDIAKRFKTHLNMLKNNKHVNLHLQASVNKYGLDKFVFSIIEECSQNDIIEKEQLHINSHDWNQLYNKAQVVYTGGSNLVEIPLFLLDLKGNVIKDYKSGADLARDLNISIAPYYSINTSAITKRKYRVVSIEFYINNIKLIESWKPYSNESEYQKSIKPLPAYKYTASKEEEIHYFFTMRELGNFLGITMEGVRTKLLSNVKFHKKSGYTIATVKKNA